MLGGVYVIYDDGRPLAEAYDGPQIVGMDLHRRRSVLVRMTRTRRYYLPGPAARTISALLTLRDHVIAPILAGAKIRRHDHVPTKLSPIDQDYEHLRTDMATLFRHLGIQPGPAAA